MHKPRWRFIAATLFIFSGFASGQDLSLSRPGNLDFANSSNGAGEWIFTGLPFSSSSYATVGYDDNVFTQHTDRTGSVYDELGLNGNINVGNDGTQPDVSSGVGILNEVGNCVYSQNRLSIGFQWTRRVATFTNYSLNVINYDSPALGQFDDRIEQLISEEIRFFEGNF